MVKRRTTIKNPDQDPSPAALDPVRRFFGGETPAEMIARVEREQERRPHRILDLVRGARKSPPDPSKD